MDAAWLRARSELRLRWRGFAALAVANLLGALPARIAVHTRPTAALRAE